MSGAFVVSLPGARRSFAVPSLQGHDRWSIGVDPRRARRITIATIGILTASVLLHGAFLATALLTDTVPREMLHKEIPVEIVTEVPKAPEPAAKVETPLPEVAKPAEPAPAAKSPPPPAAEEKAPPSPPPPVAEAPKAEPAKLPEPAKPPPAPEKPAPANTADAPKPQAAQPPPVAKDDAERKALQTELESLKAETAELEATQATEAPASPSTAVSQPMPSLGLGPLPNSFQAIALPGASSGGDGDVVGYDAIVFSQLAKAKEIGGQLGMPGSAGVQFDIDETGALLNVELVKTSGVKMLDDKALSIVRKAAPFPAPPQGAQRHFSANVSFVAGSN